MSNPIIEKERQFLLRLQEITIQLLSDKLAIDDTFNYSKGIEVIERMIEGELEFLYEEPKDYIEIYLTK